MPIMYNTIIKTTWLNFSGTGNYCLQYIALPFLYHSLRCFDHWLHITAPLAPPARSSFHCALGTGCLLINIRGCLYHAGWQHPFPESQTTMSQVSPACRPTGIRRNLLRETFPSSFGTSGPDFCSKDTDTLQDRVSALSSPEHQSMNRLCPRHNYHYVYASRGRCSLACNSELRYVMPLSLVICWSNDLVTQHPSYPLMPYKCKQLCELVFSTNREMREKA